MSAAFCSFSRLYSIENTKIMTSESQQFQGETTVNLALGNQHCYYNKFNEIRVCFVLVDLENLLPSGSAGIQPLSSDRSQDNRESVPNIKRGRLAKLEW